MQFFSHVPRITHSKNQVPSSKGVLCSLLTDRQMDSHESEYIGHPFREFRNFSFNLSSRISPISIISMSWQCIIITIIQQYQQAFFPNLQILQIEYTYTWFMTTCTAAFNCNGNSLMIMNFLFVLFFTHEVSLGNSAVVNCQQIKWTNVDSVHNFMSGCSSWLINRQKKARKGNLT